MVKHTEFAAYVVAQFQHSTLTGKDANTLVAFPVLDEDGEHGSFVVHEVRMDDVHVTGIYTRTEFGKQFLLRHEVVAELQRVLGVEVHTNSTDTPHDAILFPDVPEAPEVNHASWDDPDALPF